VAVAARDAKPMPHTAPNTGKTYTGSTEGLSLTDFLSECATTDRRRSVIGCLTLATALAAGRTMAQMSHALHEKPGVDA
jgi:hypothetical protein